MPIGKKRLANRKHLEWLEFTLIIITLLLLLGIIAFTSSHSITGETTREIKTSNNQDKTNGLLPLFITQTVLIAVLITILKITGHKFIKLKQKRDHTAVITSIHKHYT